MNEHNVYLLDCTLRDGGYINNWQWGYSRAQCIIDKLDKAGVDIVEVGFLRNIDYFDPQIMVSNNISDLNKLLPKNNQGSIYSVMAMQSDYDLSQLLPYSGEGIEVIRVTAHDYDLDQIFDYARKIKELGYKVCINPINIMGYSDDKILSIVREVNKVKPYQFSVVDTFGSMNRRNMSRIVRLIDNNMDGSIRLGLHLHENMALSYCMAQELIEMNLRRKITIDGSLMGMGRNPGNLPIELICDYANDYLNKSYNLDYLLDAIYDYILPLKGNTNWGYTPEFFLSAKYNLHRNYAEHFLKKGDLTTRDVNFLLSRIIKEKATVFDSNYADIIYDEYQNNIINDSASIEGLRNDIGIREVMILCPGKTISSYCANIIEYINKNKPIVISINFEPEEIECDFVFYSNNKRYSVSPNKYKRIVSSNIRVNNATYYINYNSICGAFDQGCNSLIMSLKLLKNIEKTNICIAGADGYMQDNNYFDESLRNYEEHGDEFNRSVSKAIERLGMQPVFLTPTLYADSVWE